MRTIAKNFAALGLGLFVSLAMLEIFLRVFPPFETRLRGNQIVLPASKQYIYDGAGLRGADQEIIHTKNSLGFRGPEVPADIDSRLRIIAIGGSTTECIYLTDEKDWPSLLHKQLEKDFAPVWVNNAGLDGHSTIGHTVLYNDLIAQLQPDIILLLVGINDVALSDGAADHTADEIKGRIRFSSLEGFIKSTAAYSEIASVSLNFYRLLRAKATGLDHENVIALPPPDIDGADITEILRPHIDFYVTAYEQRLRHLISLIRADGTAPVLVTQPALYGEGTVAWSRLTLYNEKTRIVGEEEGVLVIDLAKQLPKSLDNFYDHYHFTNSGSAEVARIVFEGLKASIEDKSDNRLIESTRL